MGNDSNPKKLTASATTTIGSVYLYAISINKALVGTLTVNEGLGTNIAIFPAAVAAGTYHVVPNGARYANLICVLSTSDDVTIFTRAA